MARAKEKLSRKEIREELREPDRILATGTRAFAWAGKHTATVGSAAAAALALLIAVGAYQAYQAAQSRDANSDLARAMALLQTAQLDTASAELRKVAERWSGSPAGALAAVLAANTDLRRGAADEGLQDFAKVPTAALPEYLRQQVEFAQATALEGKADHDAAAQKYAAAAQMSGPYTGAAMLGEARMAAQKGDAARAAELRRKVYDQFPDWPQRDSLTVQ